MPEPRRRLPIRFLALAALLAAACGDGLAPDFARLGGDVTVLRDRSGVPHVFGKSDPDVAFAVGYEHARDRLFQMDLLRRMAQGRMAEVLGEQLGGVNYFLQDWLLRAVGFYRSAGETATWARKNDHGTYALLSAYAAGVSAFIADATAGRGGVALPYGFRATELAYVPEPWTVVDSAAIAKLQTWALSSSVSYELLSTLIQYVIDAGILDDLITYAPPEKVFILDGFPGVGGAFASVTSSLNKEGRSPGGPARATAKLDGEAPRRVADRIVETVRALSPLGMWAGSNNWVVSGQHTATGKPILCNDPHLQLTSPPNLYLLHMNSADAGGTLDVAGASFPGAPVIVIGHNRKGAWGATVARSDVSDIFAEKLTDDRLRTKHESGEEPLTTSTEKIRVRGATPSAFEDREVKLQAVPRHGPVLPPEATLPPALGNADLFSIAWTGLGATNELGAFVRLNRAASVSDFVLAMKQVTTGAQNFIWADADGHIAYYAHARYPIRKTLDADHPPWFAVPGSGAYDWTSASVPDDRIPQALDPAAGFIATANNDPVGVTRDGDPLSGEFYLGPLYDPGYRAWRVTTELRRLVQRAGAGGGKITADDMKTLQTDTYMRLAERLLPTLTAAMAAARAGTAGLEAYASDASLGAAADRLAAWDRQARAASPDAALFHLWLGWYGILALRDDIGGTIYDRAVDASLDVLMRPLVSLSENPRTASGHDYFDDARTPNVHETREQIALLALRRALDHGARIEGTSDLASWRWDRIHTVTFTSTYGQTENLGPVGVQGGVGTIDVAEPSLVTKDGSGTPPDVLATSHGANLRMVVTFDASGAPSAELVIPGGQSGVPGTAHFGDQIDDWVHGRYRKLPFKRAEIEAAAESTTTLKAGATSLGAAL